MAGAQSEVLTPADLVELIAAVAKGDDTAFDRLYAATRAKLYGVVLRILRRADLADEVMQDAYLRIWRGAAEVASEEPTPLARHEMTDQLRRLLACLGDLEEERRRLVLLAYYSGWSREQLAEKFETPVNTVKTWLRRSLLQIRECLGS